MTNTLMQWLLTSAALFTSIFAAFAAYRTSGPYHSKRLAELSMQLSEQQQTLDLLASELKALRQRENMRAYRAQKPGKSAEPTDVDQVQDSGAEFRKRMNAAIAAGQVSALPRVR